MSGQTDLGSFYGDFNGLVVLVILLDPQLNVPEEVAHVIKGNNEPVQIPFRDRAITKDPDEEENDHAGGLGLREHHKGTDEATCTKGPSNASCSCGILGPHSLAAASLSSPCPFLILGVLSSI